ncbi:MAG: (d)CMP kinase [Chthoniobacterales bacterium]
MTPGAASFRRVVAIDGPAASGKSSVARELAKKLGFIYVNSGAMYRAITWHVLNQKIDPRDLTAVTRLIERTHLDCDLQNAESRILVEGVDPATHLRDVRVNDGVSLVSSVPRVREVLVDKMRAYALDHDVVMEGRDIGSVVFPDTPYKFYLDARPEIRSQRRAAEGQTDRIAVRDQADSSRRDSPLLIASDACVIDSSRLSVPGVVSAILERLHTAGLSVQAEQPS